MQRLTCFFQGELCDMEIDECASDPCENNATCVDSYLSYTCLCENGFTGKQRHILIFLVTNYRLVGLFAENKLKMND